MAVVFTGKGSHGIAMSKPAFPIVGELYFDISRMQTLIWDGLSWKVTTGIFSSEKRIEYLPSTDELEQFPALKEAWQNYLIIRKLVGLI